MSCPIHRISNVWCSHCIPQASDQRGRLREPDPRDARIAELTEALREARGYVDVPLEQRSEFSDALLARINRLLGGAG